MANYLASNKKTEVLMMTVASKFAQTVASAESVAADLKSFSLETKDQQAKQMFQQLAQSMDNTVTQLKSRLNYIMQEEPQYASEVQPTYGSGIVSTQSTLPASGNKGASGKQQR